MMDAFAVFFLGVFLFIGIQCVFHLIRRLTRKRAPDKYEKCRDITVEDWILSQVQPRVEFDLPACPGPEAAVRCKLSCRHKENYVFSSWEIGTSTEDALQKAVSQIECTIGTEWRAKRGILPEPALKT